MAPSFQKLLLTAGLCAFAGLAARPGSAQDEGAGFRVSGVLEHYVGGTIEGSTASADLSTRWLQVKGQTGTGLGFTAGSFHKKTFRALDENYLELDRGGQQWRLGRIRSGFGHSEWGDQWYNGFVNQPMMRMTRFTAGFMLSRFDTGADYRAGSSALEYRVGLVDVSAGKNDVLARRPNHVVARFQTFQAGAILGLSALVNPQSSETELFNLDWRWSSPQWIVRGELLRGRVNGFAARGEYLDIYFHPMKQFRTTLLARLEESANAPGFGAGSGYGAPDAPETSAPNSRMATLGIKQVLTRDITVSLTHGWGNRAASLRGVDGWAFQAIHYLRF